jgi:hypothetical protein
MTKILIRIPHRDDVVLTLRPGWFENIELDPSPTNGQVARFSLLLLVDDDGTDVCPAGMERGLPPERPVTVWESLLFEVPAEVVERFAEPDRLDDLHGALLEAEMR